MRLLVEFSHPAQVHKFKHVLRELMQRGSEVLILSRDKDVMLPLLDAEGLPHLCISKAACGMVGMSFELAWREIRTLLAHLRFRPDLILSAHSVAITHIGWLTRVPVVIHDDTEHATLQQRLYMPFADHIITSHSYTKCWGARQIRLASLEPLAYLHPSRFVPDSSVIAKYGLTPDSAYAVFRTVAWTAAHDVGHRGSSTSEQEQLIDRLLALGADKIVVSTEGALPISRQQLVRIAPEDLHHVLAFARLCVTEGASVAYEATTLGTPTLYLNPLGTGVISELMRLGLVATLAEGSSATEHAARLWSAPDAPQRWQAARDRLLQENGDMTALWVDLLCELAGEQAPDSSQRTGQGD